ncbi:MAG TPA: cytochrome c biogenesis protein CcdA, partial [Oceanobacillus sp.]|nr:cytochrome c biogenesis protein CcdA [Oceanobacillus sp.]
MNVTLWLAFLAGLVSFLSPCVLPLVPAYIGYMGGRVTNTVAAQTMSGTAVLVKPTFVSRLSTLIHGIAFVSGFTFVFVTLGLLANIVVQRLIGGQNIALVLDIIARVGGLLIIFFGLHFM